MIFSNAFPSNNGNNNSYQQVVEWHKFVFLLEVVLRLSNRFLSFMGANVFCLKACDPTGADDDRYCEHIFDRIGCSYNAPAAYVVSSLKTSINAHNLFNFSFDRTARSSLAREKTKTSPVSTLPTDRVCNVDHVALNFADPMLRMRSRHIHSAS